LARAADIRVLHRLRDHHAHDHADPARPVPDDARPRLFTAGLRAFSLSAVNAGTIAPFLSDSLWMLALGMAAFTAASYGVWLVYRRRAYPHLEGPAAR